MKPRSQIAESSETRPLKIFTFTMFVRLEKRPQVGAVSERVNSPPCARGSVRYGARFNRFSCSSSHFSMLTAMLC